ncbi:TadE/TadG family type IV pilus assembly protein [Aeromicrobium wangtongii]|uniref:Tad domain-containing protein n=1 Tax=Aeromicrobium wangtongii TaxID=2969247 RepID=A0ABY5M6K8_9ACTN|nr:Tad domain-containing protein [Aeromicrobium wangtongii]MCD9199263.1 Tad domain-containing protein [Aeromicrobium wangtongii]UUP12711.1 Tad domain-containing protein [Aeromicrobium wangtongii]
MSTRSEKGSASIFVIGMSLVLLVCAGLVVDGGLAINARMRVADDAEQAARVGADSIDVTELRSGGALKIDGDLARQRAAGYLQDRGYVAGQYTVDADGNAVIVEVQDTTETALLKLVNIKNFVVNGRATAEPATEPD